VRERLENEKHGLEAPLLPRKPNFGTQQVFQTKLEIALGTNDTSAGIVVGGFQHQVLQRGAPS